MNAARKKGRSGTRKYGRNEAKGKSYFARDTRRDNKKRKLVQHVALQPNDEVATNALALL